MEVSSYNHFWCCEYFWGPKVLFGNLRIRETWVQQPPRKKMSLSPFYQISSFWFFLNITQLNFFFDNVLKSDIKASQCWFIKSQTKEVVTGNCCLKYFFVIVSKCKILTWASLILKQLGVKPLSKAAVCYDIWVLSEGHKIYFKDCCLLNSQPSPILTTSLNEWSGHVKSTQTR